MKKILCTMAIMMTLFVNLFAQNTGIYKDQGGDTMTVGSGATLTVASGGTLTVASGATSTFPSGNIAAAAIAAGNLGSSVLCSSFATAGFYSHNAVRTNLGLAIGTNVQAYDADLTTYGGITPSANVQSLLGSADYATARTNMGLAIGTNVQAYDADLTTLAGNDGSALLNVSSVALAGFWSHVAIRSNLGLAIGTNVQAYDADLDDLADGSLTGSKVGSGVPAANIAAGSLGAEVICSSASESLISALTTVSAGNVTAGTLGITVIASSVGVNGVRPGSIVAGAIVNADINASAGIVDTKLAQITTASKVALTALAAGTMDVGVVASSVAADGVRPGSIQAGAIMNADINASAAIAKTKLASLDIVNADVNASAGIVDTKLATIATAGKVNVSALTGTMPIGVGPYQSSDCELLTPTAEGQLCYDTTDHVLNVSTSTLAGGFAPAF